MVAVQVFAANTTAYRQRKRAHRACEQCKKRRRRCEPPIENLGNCAGCTREKMSCSLVTSEPEPFSPSLPMKSKPSIPPHFASSVPLQRDPDQAASGVPNENINSTATSPSGRMNSVTQSGISRFIGDLCPESVFHTSRSNIPVGNQCSYPAQTQRTEVGVWVRTDDGETTEGLLEPGAKIMKRKRGNTDLGEDPGDPSSGGASLQLPGPADLFEKYLQALDAYSLPPPTSRSFLVKLYLRTVHPFLPLLNPELLLDQDSRDAIPLLLLKSILLVICRHPSALRHLSLSNPGSSQCKLLQPRVFAERVYAGIKALLFAGIEKDRMTLIRVYALLSLHAEGNEGNERASRDLSTAIHHAHSVGIHIRRASATNSREGEKEGSPTDVWWCLWSLDQIQAAMNGRPILTRTEDVSIELPVGVGGVDLEEWSLFRRNGKKEGRYVFGSWLRLAALLQNVISLYRPGREGCWERQWPEFEEIANCESAHRAEAKEGDAVSIRDTLRTFHLAVAILSHRSRLPPQTPVMAESQARRINAAFKLLEVIKNHDFVDMPPLPIIPYAISLSMTTFYSILREPDSHNNAQKEKDAYKCSYKLLQKLSHWWWFAETMAKLGKEGLERLETGRIKGNDSEPREGGRDDVGSKSRESEAMVCKKRLGQRGREQWKDPQKPRQSPHQNTYALSDEQPPPSTPLSTANSSYLESTTSASTLTTNTTHTSSFSPTPLHHHPHHPPFASPYQSTCLPSDQLEMSRTQASYPTTSRESEVWMETGIGTEVWDLDLFFGNFQDLSNPTDYFGAGMLGNVIDAGEQGDWAGWHGGG